MRRCAIEDLVNVGVPDPLGEAVDEGLELHERGFLHAGNHDRHDFAVREKPWQGDVDVSLHGKLPPNAEGVVAEKRGMRFHESAVENATTRRKISKSSEKL
jgi:hypothetical protein